MASLIRRKAAIDALKSCDCNTNGIPTGAFITSPFIEGIPCDDSITINSTNITIEDVMDLIRRLYAKPTLTKIKCSQCGASFDQKADDHIFKCPYCRTAYFVGTEMINDEP